jgi:hypothetical protein
MIFCAADLREDFWPCPLMGEDSEEVEVRGAAAIAICFVVLI